MRASPTRPLPLTLSQNGDSIFSVPGVRQLPPFSSAGNSDGGALLNRRPNNLNMGAFCLAAIDNVREVLLAMEVQEKWVRL